MLNPTVVLGILVRVAGTRTLALAVIVASCCAGPVASAQAFPFPEGNPARTYPMLVADGKVPRLQSAFGEGFASDAEIAASVGKLNFSMNVCDQSARRRVVRVQLSRSNADSPRVADGILFRAADFAWQSCPLTTGESSPQFPKYNIEEVDVYLPNGTLAYKMALGEFVYGDQILGPGEEYRWRGENLLAAARQQAEFQAARVQQEQRTAEVRAQSAASSDQFWAQVWFVIKLLFWSAVAIVLFRMRETFARWYYLLTPHPARHMVEGAIERGTVLDGAAFSEIMRPMPGGRIEQEVRAEQARQLAARAHKYAEAMRAEADRLKTEAARDAEYIGAQQHLVDAAVAHEKAKARLEALRKRLR